MAGATLSELKFDGRLALSRILTASEYWSVGQAIASLTCFPHPETVRQTRGAALFPAVRSIGRSDRGQYVERDGRSLRLDDNAAPIAAFDWSHGLARRPRDVQLNHIYLRRDDPDSFTALPNMCRTPSFLAKLTDQDPVAQTLLKRRSYDLYGWRPHGEPVPEEPEGYSALRWAAPLPPVDNIELRLRGLMARRPLSFCTVTAREIGWLFSDGLPDASFVLSARS